MQPGGVLLATFSGISQTYEDGWQACWYWSFTTPSARLLFNEAFGENNVTVEAFGNVLAAVSFLEGLASQELTRDELDTRDSGYDVTITVRAMKAGL